MNDRKGTFIMIDGPTGSGKSTVIKAIQAWATQCNHRIFSTYDWKQPEPPIFEHIPEFDVLFSYEPSRTWVGSAIRYEMSRDDNPYTGEELAHAFALDRSILYKRLIIPALLAGKTVIQDRGLGSSCVYQPIMPNSVPLENILSLPGNQTALAWAPDHLILTQTTPDVIMKRIKERSDDHKGVFADPNFIQEQVKRYASNWLRELFEKQGTTVHAFSTSQSLEETQKSATQLIHSILTTC